MAFLLRTTLPDPPWGGVAFNAVKTMYGGKTVAAGDTVYVLAEGPAGLVARGVVAAAAALARPPGTERWTPRVALELGALARPRRRLVAADIRRLARETPGHPAAEIDFRFYRQATPKLGGLSPKAAGFLEGCF